MTEQDKRVRWAQSQIEEFSEDVSYYALSEQQVSALLTAIGVIDWRTRWIDGESSFYLEFGASLANQLMTPIDFCAEMVNCIETSDSVQGALSNAANGGDGLGYGGEFGAGKDGTFPESVSSENILDGASCGNDTLFAIATQFTDYAFEAVKQVFDLIDAALNNVELVAALGDNVPAWGQTPFQIALETAIWVQQTADDNFEAFDSLQKRQEIACDIFCIMVDNNCEFSFDDAWNYFAEKSAIALFDTSLESALQQVTGLTTPDAVGYSSLALMFGTLALGARFGSIRNINSVLVVITSFFNDTNPDWAILCDPCTDECTTTPQQISITSWTTDDHPCIDSITVLPVSPIPAGTISQSIGNPAPSVIEGKGATAIPGEYGFQTYVQVKFKRALSLDTVSFQYNYTQPVNNVLAREMSFYDENGTLIGTPLNDVNGGQKNTWNTVNVDVNVSVWEIRFRIGVVSGGWNAGTPLHGYIDNAIITENGYTP
jgi:hypothetical protein